MRVLISPRLPKYFKCGHSSHVIPLIETIPYYLMHYHRIFSLHLLWHSTTGDKNIFKLLAISQSCQFQLFLTDLLLNFWKIAQLLGKVKNTASLRFISFSFSRKKNGSLRGHVLTGNEYSVQWLVITIWSRGVAWIIIFITFNFFVPSLLGIVFLCCKVFEIVKVGSSTPLAEFPFWHAFYRVQVLRMADFRVTWLVYIRSYCVPMANLNQQKRSQKLYFGVMLLLLKCDWAYWI